MSSLPATCLLLFLVVCHHQLTSAAPQQRDDAGEGPIGAGHPDGEPMHAGHQEMGTRVSKSPFERQQVSGALPLEGQLLQWMRDTFAKGPEHGHIRSMLDVQESYDFGPELTTVSVQGDEKKQASQVTTKKDKLTAMQSDSSNCSTRPTSNGRPSTVPARTATSPSWFASSTLT